jgi:antitoxin component YwqK of YwqJK toxin-antitoxin module
MKISTSNIKIVIPNVEKDRIAVEFELINGVLFFKEKAYSGIVNEFYSSKNIKTKSEYYKGKRHGFYKGWYMNGNKWFQRFYTKGLKSNIHRGWYLNGNQMFEYQFNKNGLYDGSVKDWHEKGILGKHFNFVNGIQEGSQKMWDLSGKISANFYAVNRDRHGLIGLKKCVSVIHKDE